MNDAVITLNGLEKRFPGKRAIMRSGSGRYSSMTLTNRSVGMETDRKENGVFP